MYLRSLCRLLKIPNPASEFAGRDSSYNLLGRQHHDRQVGLFETPSDRLDGIYKADSTSRTTKVRVQPVKIASATTQDSLIFGEIDTGSNEAILKVPSAALVFSRNHQYVIKGPAEKMSAVEIQVIGESDNFSSVRPVKSGQLAGGDLVAGRGGIFLLK